MDGTRQNTCNIMQYTSRTKMHRTLVTPSLLDRHGQKKVGQAVKLGNFSR